MAGGSFIERLADEVARRVTQTPAVSKVTISELFERYEKIARVKKSWKDERNLLMPLVSRLGALRACELVPEKWGDHRKEREQTPTQFGRPPSAITLDMELFKAKRLLKFAVTCGLLTVNPLAEVKTSGAVSRRTTWLTYEQLETLLRASRRRPLLHAWVLVAVSTGMRISETLTLRFDRIGENGIVMLGWRWTKTKDDRVVALSPEALDAVFALPRLAPWVFCNPKTLDPYSQDTIRRWFREACLRGGLDAFAADGDLKILPHDARHACASLLDQAGVSITAIAATLGHKKTSTTERYTHRDKIERALSVAKMITGRRGPRKSGPVTTLNVNASPVGKISHEN